MNHIYLKIHGVPYSRAKTRGNVEAPKEWTKAIEEQTQFLPKVKEACIMKVTFLLPPNKFPKDLPYGSDLDNLLKRFMDALNETIFSETVGKDSCVVSMHVSKVKVENEEESGVLLEIMPVSVT
ncbi:MAG: RusA family crossover junction endodeoxyribonuclease [Proteobacteria bacterium]|nr:RusA family crossover junction endodeoxyribonuclease [Pseudomonadota bacterium]MBU4257625.1 RusA family crossover junction endodeoxyribonuclease [Patescibacteria group bacterium]